MAGLTPTAMNNMLDSGLRLVTPTISITHASLHTGDPSTTGANEVTGGSPAYARKAITFATASSQQIAASTQPVFDVPASTTVTYVGFFSAITTGTFLGSALVTSEAFGAQGTYTLTAATISLS
jgi:hypothetical protein